MFVVAVKDELPAAIRRIVDQISVLVESVALICSKSVCRRVDVWQRQVVDSKLLSADVLCKCRAVSITVVGESLFPRLVAVIGFPGFRQTIKRIVFVSPNEWLERCVKLNCQRTKETE